MARAGSFEWDFARKRVRWSDELCRIYGVEPDTFSGTIDDFLARVVPEDVHSIGECVQAALASRSGFTNEYRIVRPDGAVRRLYTRADVIRDEQHRPLRLIGTSWDITDRQFTDETLASSLSLLRATLEASADGLLVVDRAGRIRAYNEQFLSLWRIPHGLVKQRRDDILLDYVLDQLSDPAAFLRGVHYLYVHSDRESFESLAFKDGRVFERLSRPQLVEGQIVGRVWSFRDVTQRERLLREQEFLSDTSRLLASLDIEAALAAVAQRAVPYLGRACAIDLFSGDEQHRLVTHTAGDVTLEAPLPPQIRTGRSLRFEIAGVRHLVVALPTRDHVLGAITLAAPRDRPYDDSDVAVAEELGRRAALAIENARLFRESQEALRARDEFLSIAGHEIRGPLTSIQLAAETLRHPEVPPVRQERMLGLVEREIARLARFVDDLVELGRIRSGLVQLELEPIDLAEVVRDIAAHYQPELARARSELELTTPERLVGRWDRLRLEQVLMNLMSNAIKFGRGGPIGLELDATDDRAILVVSDRGIGVPPAQRERIFQLFERGVPARQYGGLGLGLFISRTIVEYLGGTLRVEPGDRGGSKFIVELPRKGPT